MQIFKLQLPAALLAAVVVATSAAADVVRFNDEVTHLSGDITAIHDNGIIELKSPLTPTPLQLNSSYLSSAEFTHNTATPPTPPIAITLTNKDILPVFKVIGMEGDDLVADSPAGTNIRIPRSAIQSAQFGIAPPRTIYGENNRIEDWLDEMEERENWQVQSGTLVSRGRASASHTLDLPENFTIRFTLEWQDNQGPDLQVHLCTPEDNAKGDDYRFILNSSGMRITRTSVKEQSSYTLTQLRRNASQYKDNRMVVEIDVMRSQQRLALWIDGKEEARVADPIEHIPNNNTITIRCGNPSGTRQTISNLRIDEYNDTHARQLAEDHGDPSSDILITRDEDRWAGKLLNITNTTDATFIHFQTDFIDQPVEIELSEVSTLRFARSDMDTDPKGTMCIHLHGDGRLHAKTCTLSDDHITASHPLLGTLLIDKSHTRSITRIATQPESQPAE